MDVRDELLRFVYVDQGWCDVLPTSAAALLTPIADRGPLTASELDGRVRLGHVGPPGLLSSAWDTDDPARAVGLAPGLPYVHTLADLLAFLVACRVLMTLTVLGEDIYELNADVPAAARLVGDPTWRALMPFRVSELCGRG